MFQWPGVGVGAFSIGTWMTVGTLAASASRRAPAELVGGGDHLAARAHAPAPSRRSRRGTGRRRSRTCIRMSSRSAWTPGRRSSRTPRCPSPPRPRPGRPPWPWPRPTDSRRSRRRRPARRPPGCGWATFTPSTAEGPKPMVARPLGRDERPGNRDRELLADAVLVPAHVGDDEAVLRHRLAQLAEDPLRAEGILVGLPLLAPVGGEGPPRGRDLLRASRRACGMRVPRAAADSAPSASFASATTPSSVGKFRPISAGSTSMWISRVGGIANVYRGSHELEFASASRVPTARIRSAVRHFSLAMGVPQKPVMPSSRGWSSRMHPLAIRLWATGHLERLRQGRQLRGGPAEDITPPPGVEQRAARPRRAPPRSVAPWPR